MFNPIYMKNVNLILGTEAEGTDFACQLRSVTLTPDVNVTRTKTLCPTGQYSNVDEAEWTLELGYLDGTDDSDPAAALSAYLLANAGEKVDFFFAPVAGGNGWSGIVTLIPGAVGGEVGNYSEQTVQLPVDGQPEAWTPSGS